jgi:osmoprotectant transport system ATP-binding protein
VGVSVVAAQTNGPGGAAVRLRGVTVNYAGRAAVDAVDLDVAGGEFIVLLGPSGSGKSTLLRTINRLVVPDAGSIEIDGRDAASEPPETLRRGIGYAIQAVGLFPHMSVAQNVAVVPELLGWERADIAARVDELLGLVRLDPARYGARFPRQLSGGEQQRVGVARALAAKPRLLLMDEPFGAVDAIVRAELQEETLRIHRVLGTTIFFVTHDVDEALRLADRIVVLKGGRVEQIDSPLRVLAKPATAYVAALLDSKDAIRRLQLLSARDALTPVAPASGESSGPRVSTEATGPQVSPNATLREVLSVLLEGAPAAVVAENGHSLGSVSFDDVRAALARTER